MTVLAVSAGSIAGVAARIALLRSAVNFFPSSSQLSVNMVGSFVIGVIFGVKDLEKLTPWTHAALTVGFCGSFTTFSSWIYSMLKPSADWSIELLTGITIPIAALIFGRDIAQATVRAFAGPKDSPDEKEVEHNRIMDYGIVALLSVAAIATSIPLVVTGNVSSSDMIACAIGPLGALTRWVLCTVLNAKSNYFMMGTFASNLLGCLIAGALGSCKTTNDWCNYSVVGIAGSLSTVSSWALDTVKLHSARSPEWAYFYYLFSVAVGVAVVIPFSPN